ncbi:anaphase-promoting complex subunit cdc27 [Xylographa opegraphella]|nr:anaphase-promoting complex subunit cdc27 [Xylographa opegraphella]
MSPSTHHVAHQLRLLIYYHLDCNLLRNALFFAGRLHAYEPRATEAAYLLALCHLRLGQLKAAYDSSKNPGSRGTHLGCSYIFAQACLGLERYGEGLAALEKSRGLWISRNSWNKHTDIRRQPLPDAAAVHCLQGKLSHAYGDTNRAIECYAEALKLNSLMWDAFVGLCDLGVNVRIPNIFKMTPAMMIAMESGIGEETFLGELGDSPPSDNLLNKKTQPPQIPSSNDPFSIATNRVNNDTRSSFTKSALYEKLNGSTVTVTPIGTGTGIESEVLDTPTGSNGCAIAPQDPWNAEWKAVRSIHEGNAAAEPPLAPTRKSRTIAGLDMKFGIDAPPRMKASHIRIKSRTHGDSEEMDGVASTISSFMTSSMAERKRTVSGQIAQSVIANPTLQQNPSINDPMAPQRRSVRLFNQIRPQSNKFAASTGSLGLKEGRDIKKAKSIGTRRAQLSTVGRVVSGNRKHIDPMDIDSKEGRYEQPIVPVPFNPKPAVSEKTKESESLQYLLDLFTKLGSGYFALSHYRCEEALKIFNSITPSQRETPWVLAQMGRALFEQTSYTEAEKYFARIKAMFPARLEDMEVYSTILWHLKSEVDLAFLAHEILDIDRLSPQAWCAVGNSFSLQRDHDQALKCFKRATQLDPKFAYAFTLQGHEHVANEEYDKAMAAYRNGIAAENRHYNAWYGLGRVYEKQGKYNVAEQHYRTAAGINPTNAVLVCCIGVVLEKMKNPKAALVQYARSCDLAPKSALSRFKKARVLMALQQPDEALRELNVLKDIVPDEANVHFLLGRVYKILRQKGDAIKHFTTALNLDPKASHYIKEVMEQMEDEDDEDGPMAG